MCACTDPPALVAAGIDAAALTGWAIVSATGDVLRLRAHGAVAIATSADVELLVAEIASAAPVLVAVEAPFMKGSDRGGNAHSSLELAVLHGRFVQALGARGVAAAAVLASTWQPRILGVGRWSNRQQRKSAAVAWAGKTFGVELGHDIADAAAIAVWALRKASGRPTAPEQKQARQGEAEAQGSLWGKTT
jgi:Holliday junction resolvasome RuvABC endonuclease subunit